ncbi:MAG: ACP S-malonyltransferase [Deltaproteobacteria bacterium]|jgi:[acyl-carrier-protein] S-malonyltransferase|nr:ACP S-malonyltransferase [Deltaproteobacteria bacterium]
MNDAKTAFVFPGQGGQFVGQGKAWAESYPAVREIFRAADEVTGRPISKLCFEGPLEDLTLTLNLQPAILAVSLAAARLHLAAGRRPDYTLGHSLGEFAALCLAGVFDEAAAFDLVNQRAALMQKAAMDFPGSMAAVLNLDVPTLESLCELARAEGTVVVANYNTPEQTVISGTSRAVAAASRFVLAKGGKTVPLPVSGAFHSPLMADSASRFADILRELDFKTPKIPVAPNTLAVPTTDTDDLKNALIRQMTSPVRWVESVEALKNLDVKFFYECWPKPYANSLVKKCLGKEPGFTLEAASPA